LHEFNDIRHTETLSPEPTVPEPTTFELGQIIKIWHLNHHILGKCSTTDYCSLILVGLRQNCLNCGRNQPLYLLIGRVIKETAVIIEAYHCY